MDIENNISVAVEADGKSARLMEKSCVTRTFCSHQDEYETSELVDQTLLNLWFKLCLSIIIQLVGTFMRNFLGGCDEK